MLYKVEYTKIQKKVIRIYQYWNYRCMNVDNQFEPQKKCIENDVALMRKTSFQNIFNEPENGQPNHQEEQNFLFLEDIFYASVYSPHQDNPFYEDSEPHFANPFQESPQQRQNWIAEPNTETQNESSKPIFKSSYTKNACFNICQKTIKVIKKGLYEFKLEEICEQNNTNTSQFKNQIVKKKKNFTGPKALSTYLETKSNESKVFAEFMKWFLTQKYLRMAINQGEMKNLKVYIEFKNHFLLPLLN